MPSHLDTLLLLLLLLLYFQHTLETLLEDKEATEARDVARHKELCDMLVHHRSAPEHKGFVGLCKINHR